MLRGCEGESIGKRPGSPPRILTQIESGMIAAVRDDQRAALPRNSSVGWKNYKVGVLFVAQKLYEANQRVWRALSAIHRTIAL